MQAVTAPELLTALLTAPGPSGHEEEAARLWREAASTFAEVTSDRSAPRSPVCARATARRPSRPSGTSTRSGVAITNIEESGCSRSPRSAASGPATLIGQRVELLTGRLVPGAMSAQAHHARADARPAAPQLTELHIDSVRRTREDAERLVRVGDAGVWRGRRSSCQTARLLSKALDNRLGAASGSRRRGASPRPADGRSMSSRSPPSRRRSGCSAPRRRRSGSSREVALAVDVTPATDVPGGDAPRRRDRARHGRDDRTRADAQQQVVDLLAEAAEAESIPHSFEIYTRTTTPTRTRSTSHAPGSRPGCCRSRRDTCTVRTRSATSRTSRRSCADRRLRPAPDPRPVVRSLDEQRHRQRGSHAVREAGGGLADTRRPSWARS